MVDAETGGAGALKARLGESSWTEGPRGDRKETMDWEGFFTHYRKPGFIPGYEIVNKLGSGVFGEVYKARKESIGKFYAVKFLKIADEKVSEAIFKELDSLRHFAQLDHPNLVSIEDKGEVMGIPYIVMGYGGDETLKKRLATAPLSLAEAADIFRQVAAGVGALHEKSIIHFDLKPANVFMKGNHARVGDYGLSKLVSESHNTMSIGRGTPYYMAPEMLKRRGDYRSDIYSLGVILFELVTGQVPFTGDSEWEVLRKHESEPVAIPASVVEPYRSVIERALAKAPEKRFQTVGELLQMLDGGSRPQRPAPANGRVLPPPPPAARASTPPPPPLLRQPGSEASRAAVAAHLGSVLGRIRTLGGPAAERARQRLFEARRSVETGQGAPRTLESFYSDFTTPEAPPSAPSLNRPSPAAPPPIPVAAAGAPASGAAPTQPAQPESRSILTLPFRLVWLVLWPIRMLFWLLWQGVRGIGKGLSLFFSNFLRYTIVIAVTVGLCVLAHALIVGDL